MDVQPWVIAVGAAAALLVLKRLAAPRAPAELVRQRIGAGASVVDVRSPGEFQGGAYPGAVNIPLQVLASRLRELSRDRPVVLYCASGMRSASAARLLKRAGFADVVNAGGLHHMPR